MEPKAAELLAVLTNTNLSIDAKVTHLLGLKSDIKQKNVPEGAVPPIFECLRLSIASPHSALIAAGFSTLGHFLKRLFIQGQQDLVSQHADVLYPHLLERLGDHKERHRAQSAQAFTELWPAANAAVESNVLGVALKSKNPRAKQAALLWLSHMHQTEVILFRGYVPDIVSCLEDADQLVRAQGKSTLVDLFENAPPRAKADLKLQMALQHVRSSIADPIFKSIGLEVDPAASRPPSRGDALHNRPPSRGDALHNRPPSRGDALHNRPPSRGDALHNRPPSRGDALHNRPPSRGDALHNRPASRGDALHNRAASRGDALHTRTPSRGDTLHQQQFATSTSAVMQHDSEVESETPPTLVKPVPIRPHQSPSRGGPGRIPKAGYASVDRRPAQPNSERASEELTSKQSSQSTAPKDAYQEPTKRQLEKCEVAPYKITPRDVASARDFENILRDISPPFQGRETENNWMPRFHNLLMLRRLTLGNAPHDYPQAFSAAIKSWLDNIFKVALSLRTSMITMGCFTVQDLARVLGSRLDPMIDIIMQNLMKLCVNMKKLASSNGNRTVEVVLENVTRNSRLLSHVTAAALDKNNNLRLFGTGWIKIIINNQGVHKVTSEGVTHIEACIKKNLFDATPAVREAMRSTFWDFYRAWPSKGLQMLDGFDAKFRTLLEKDPSNPNNDPFASNSASSKTGLFSSTSAHSGRPALKDVAAEGRKGNPTAPAKGIPSSPRAQQSALPDAASIDRPRKPLTSRAVPMGTHTSSLTSAPMRPGVSKPRPPPLDVARPATASGFHPNPPVSPTRDSPTRIPVTIQSPFTKPVGAPRPRQKSDPSQDASPTKIRTNRIDPIVDHADRPFGTLNIPKSRANDVEKKDDENNAATKLSIEFPARPIIDERINDEKPTARRVSIEFAARAIHDEEKKKNDEHMRPRKLSIEVKPRTHDDERKNDEKPAARRVSTEFAARAIHDEEKDDEHIPQRKLSIEVRPRVHDDERRNDENIPPRMDAIDVGARRISNTHRLLPEWSKIDHMPHKTCEMPDVHNDEDTPGSLVDDAQATRNGSTPTPRAENKPLPKLDFDNMPELHADTQRQPSNRYKRAETTPKRRNLSPRSQDIVQAREMIVKGTRRIRAKDMDITGYRKIQGLIEYHDTLFTDEEEFDYMLMALLDELQSQLPSEDMLLPFGTTWDLKFQVLVTIRYMFDYARKYFVAYYPTTVITLLRAQRQCEIAPTLGSGLEHLLHDILAVCDLVPVVDAIVEVLDTEEENDLGYKSLQKGLEVLADIFARMNRRRIKMPDDTLAHFGPLGARALAISATDVKRGIIATCVQLRLLVADDDRLWRALGKPSENIRSLILYYNTKGR
ncbi:uncharacterized protein BJX67DRAFT_87045 [Aspergillus lucknowensis]|uniref:Clasp N terminal-domain-containing protein n=1 Tax=Aspergillus lucknowensis TaxID=176173 RepID=A0ABR4M5B4_9EURO